MPKKSLFRATRMKRVPFVVEDFLTQGDRGKILSNHKAGETVFRQGEPADSVCYLQSGRMMLTVLSPTGQQAIVSLLQAGDFFGEWALLANQRARRYTATALSDCLVSHIPKKMMEQVLQNHPALAKRFLAHLLTKGIQAQENLTEQVFHTTEKRLARALILLSGFGDGPRLESVIPRVSQQTLAALVGSSRQQVNLFMTKFRNLGLISYDRHTRQLIVHGSLQTFLLRH